MTEVAQRGTPPAPPESSLEYQLILSITKKLRSVPTKARDRIIRQLVTHAQAHEGQQRLGLLQNINVYAHNQATLKAPVVDHTLDQKLEEISSLFNIPVAHLQSACQRGPRPTAVMLN